MEVAAGAMTPLLGKLGDLVVDEFKLEKHVKKGVKSLITELEIMHAVLRKVGEIPPDQLDKPIRIWAGKVRELSYDMEDAVDAYLVRVEDVDCVPSPINVKNKIMEFLEKITKLFSKGKDLHQISDAIKEARELAKELGELRQRYMLEANSTGDTIDPRLKAMYKDVTEFVGIDHTRDELIKMLMEGDEGSKQQLKTISIVGFGGLGKTTLAKAVYDKIKVQFDCGAFVPVSQKPDMKKIFKKMLHQLDENKYAHINEADRDEQQLIGTLRTFLQNKRYLIVIDDIWNKEAWEIIKCAFSNTSRGSRVMTTTRIGSVSEACCSSDSDIYKMKPLSGVDSERLFYKRIFPQGSECPQELKQVSTDILKKCGGVPLAIITIASLLASNDQQAKTKDQWQALLKSIGRGLTEDASVAEMQKILSFSYYNLPSHLKTCLLYLCIFPEDYEIGRDRLIWRWIAEGFVQGGRQETRSLFEIGESYFNDLINRSMIQPGYVDVAEGRARTCRVHDMVLDLIRILSSEENFVTVFDGTGQRIANSQSKVRRLSFQNSMSEVTTPQPDPMDTTSMSQVRSVTLFKSDADLIQPLSCFQVLRVLDLEGCYLGEINLRCIGNLLHLRYLGLRYTRVIGKLPKEIEKLKFLQTLDLRNCGLDVPWWCVVRLRRLMRLYVDLHARMPVGMANLASLEYLTCLRLDGFTGNEKELGKLIQLRVLGMSLDAYVGNESVFNSLVESLGNLQKLQSLGIYSLVRGTKFEACWWDRWVPSPHLRNLAFCTSTLPRWINSLSLPLLCRLDIQVDEVREGDIQILGMLPALRSVKLETTKQQCTCVKKFIIGADVFPCVKECEFNFFLTAPCMFPRGAMPRLEYLEFFARASDIASGELDVGMVHLPSLQRLCVNLWIEKRGYSYVKEEAKAKLRLAVEAHPNRPIFSILFRDLPTESDDESQEEVLTGTEPEGEQSS